MAASVVVISLSLPLCPCLQPLLTFPRPMRFLETLKTSPSIQQMPSDFPTVPGHVSLIPPITPHTIYTSPCPPTDHQCCFVPLFSSLLNLNLNLNLNPNPNLYQPAYLPTCSFYLWHHATYCLVFALWLLTIPSFLQLLPYVLSYQSVKQHCGMCPVDGNG